MRGLTILSWFTVQGALSGQYGLKKLVEHIWMIIGMAKTCETMTELRDRVAELDGKHPVQMRLYLGGWKACLRPHLAGRAEGAFEANCLQC